MAAARGRGTRKSAVVEAVSARLSLRAGGLSSPRGGAVLGSGARGSRGADGEGRGHTSLPCLSSPFLRRGVEIKRPDPGRPNQPRPTKGPTRY